MLHDGSQNDVFFIGMEDKTAWERDIQTFYVLIPAADKALMLRNTSQESTTKLLHLLTVKFHAEVRAPNPTLFHRGEKVSEQTLKR